MWERIRVILRKEFIQLLREPRMRGMIFLAPLIQLIMFGYAVTLDVDHTRIAWRDMSRTPESRALRARFEGSGHFEVVALPRNDEEVQQLLDRSEVHAVVSVLPTFARELARRSTAQVQVLLDGTDSNTASLVSAYAAGAIAGFAEDVALNSSKNAQMIQVTLRKPGTQGTFGQGQIIPSTRAWFNPDLRSRNYFIPGVAANLLLMLTMMLTAQAIIREKEIGTLEQLMVTPMRPIELMLGKIVPYIIIAFIDLNLIILLGKFVFHVPFCGSFALFLFLSFLFLASALSMGLFISSIAKTAQVAWLISFVATILPSIILSGFIFPISNMPKIIQFISYLLPVRYFLVILRGIILKGVGLSILYPQALVLLFFAMVLLTICSFRFKKRIA